MHILHLFYTLLVPKLLKSLSTSHIGAKMGKMGKDKHKSHKTSHKSDKADKEDLKEGKGSRKN